MNSAALVRLVRIRRMLLAHRPKRRQRLPRQVPPLAVEVYYLQKLLGFRARILELVKTRVLDELASLLAEAARDRGDSEREDAAGRRGKDIVDGIRRELLAKVPDAEARRVAEEVAVRVREHGKEQLDRQLRAGLGVDVFRTEPSLAPHLGNFVEQNVGLIRSVPEEMLYRVEQGLLLGLRQNWRAEELAQHLQQQLEVSQGKAGLIARDQVSKLNGELNELRQKNMGLTEYIWRTVRDEAVRASHAEKEGQRFQWANPPADTGHPGEDVNCRCSAEPYLEGLLSELEEE